MEYVRLRAPAKHGESLVVPAGLTKLIRTNQNRVASFGSGLASIWELARGELVSLAYDYSRQYANVPRPKSDDRVVMGGHQPELFHPGVWLKNFVLSHVGQKANAVSINLIVDNDLCQSTALSVPVVRGKDVGLSQIAFDQPGKVVPFEQRSILDRSMFESFGDVLAKAISPVVVDPLIGKLWPGVVGSSQVMGGRLGASLAAGRHLLELESGLSNLELPISSLSTTVAFANFFAMIARQSGEFAEVYNRSLLEYRKTHRIRSSSHPVAALQQQGRWQEVPFWCWTENQERRRVFVRPTHAVHLALSDGKKVLGQFDPEDLNKTSLGSLLPGVVIRPKALTTTMFARLFGCDLFIHGIGGSKYDQLTDRIVEEFFGIQLPGYVTCTATMKLPFSVQATSREDVVQLQQQQREMRFHPEKFLSDDAEELKRAKQSLLAEQPQGSRKSWHDELEKTNAAMGKLLECQRLALEQELARAKVAVSSGQVINSREFGFPLFSESLTSELKAMSAES